MQKFGYFAILVFISIKTNLINAAKLKSCLFHNLDECPLNTKCSEQNNLCECLPNYDFNENYQNDTDYCISHPILLTTESIIDITTSSSLSLSKTVTYEPIEIGSHHLIGGILIPIFIVLSVIGAAYGLKRLELIRRFREFQIRRRRQPFYEDVMMNQDNDDPPLI